MGIRCRRLIVLGQRRSPRAPVAVAALHRPEPDSDPTPLEPLSARRRRCSRCSRRLAVSAGTLCRCGQLLCNEHRHAEAHDCTFDYKALAYRGDTPGPSSASCQRSDWVDVRGRFEANPRGRARVTGFEWH
ncbi:hypothetical protein JKP88DRAFT_272989 [Tribonema minus]|uniref:AN1-type domain-containing protein n=1 Tax=Tribonema minus TaxID=303371 RepID=A0A836CGL3_9STRA|nr:hypothetical protein JKP88DRAFT_272989 [Tribonema minus]